MLIRYFISLVLKSRPFFLALFCTQAVVLSLAAQPNLGYVEVPEDVALDEQVKRASKEAVQSYDGFYKSKLKDMYDRRDEQLLGNYYNGEYLLDDYWQGWIDGLLTQVVKANPVLKSEELRVFVGRSTSVNARCYGNGVIVIDLGLLVRLQNEEQVSFVLCHEIAHQVLDHVDNRYADRIDRLYSKETQKQLRVLKRSNAAGAYSDYTELTRKLAFDFSRHSRYGESEADSLGITFYQNAGLNSEGPIGLMQVLAKADSSQYNGPLDLKSMLSTADFKPKARWFFAEQDDFLMKTDTLSALVRDSLRTHPDTDLRLHYLADVLQQSLPVATELDETHYSARLRLAEYALTAGAFDASRLDLSLYHSLRGLEKYPDDAWYRGVAALSISYLGEARLSTAFNEVSPMPKRHHQEYRKALMQMLHNMRSSDYKQLAYYYALAISEDQQTPESTLAMIVALELDSERTKELRAAKLRFRKTYPKHPYQTWLVND